MQKEDTEEATYSQLNNEVEERAVGHKKGEERPLQKKEVQEGADPHKRGEKRPLQKKEVQEGADRHKRGEERPLQKKLVKEGADCHEKGEKRPIEEQEINRPNTPRKGRPCRKWPLSSSTPSLYENKKGYKLGNKCTKQALDFRVRRLIGDICSNCLH